MVTQVFDPALMTTSLSERELEGPLMQRLLDTLQPILGAASPRAFRNTLDAVTRSYVPFKFLFAVRLVSRASQEGKTGEDIVQEINYALWDLLGSASDTVFSNQDRRLLMEALRWQSKMTSLAQQAAAQGNGEAFDAAFLDGFWALQKADVCLSSAVLLAQGLLKTAPGKTSHWLCTAARRSQQQFDDALFANSPELTRRLETPGKTFTTKELERRLDL